MLKTELIKRFLASKAHDDLATLYTDNMEVQVQVARDGGECVEGVSGSGHAWRGWTDGTSVWKSFRIPWNAGSNPDYRDSECQFDFEAHVEGIGMTGWDWRNRVSKWIAFDFDSVTNHVQGLTTADLLQIQDIVQDVPWVTVRTSTSGAGLHLYVFLDDVPTENHHEHAALARAILSKLIGIVGKAVDKVDVVGGNMWVWHRKRTLNGLKLIKRGEKLYEIPPNWRDHVGVVSGRYPKNRPSFIDAGAMDSFEYTAGQTTFTPLDSNHKALIHFLEQSGAVWWWDSDRHMLVTHTIHLQEAHKELGLKGYFTTNSAQTTPHNCFAFPLKDGAWVVRRYGKRVQESNAWHYDNSDWARAYLNKEMDLQTVARIFGAVEDSRGGFVFSDVGQMTEALNILAVRADIPISLSGRSAMLDTTRDGRLLLKISRDANADATPKGWLPKGKYFEMIHSRKIVANSGTEVAATSDRVRHLVTHSDEDAGWVYYTRTKWTREPLEHLKLVLRSEGNSSDDINNILGNAIAERWQLTNIPFGPEYPGNRRWNRDAVKYAIAPKDFDKPRQFPTWQSLFSHLGKTIDDIVRNHAWCAQHGIVSGADYLKYWVASVFQHPYRHLPYLFFYSEKQNTGKSTFHEALALLVSDGGVADASLTLEDPRGFNGELATAVFCYVEEKTLTKRELAYERIKAWVTALMLPIHIKQCTPYRIPNTTHWIHCSNDPGAVPISKDDTRITMVEVLPLAPTQYMPKETMMNNLRKESADFLAEILSLSLPPPFDRLGLPTLETEEKAEAQQLESDMFDSFIQQKLNKVGGHRLLLKDIVNAFYTFAPSAKPEWSSIRISKKLRASGFEKGRGDGGQHYIINVSLDPFAEPSKKMTYGIYKAPSGEDMVKEVLL